MGYTEKDAKRATHLYMALRNAEDIARIVPEFAVSAWAGGGKIEIHEGEAMFAEAKSFFERAAKWRVADLKMKLRAIGAEVPE